MYGQILVALDSSTLSQVVLKQAIAFAQSVKGKLLLLHVLSSEEVMSPTMPLIPVPEYYPSLSVTTLELYEEEWKAFQAKSLVMLADYKRQAEAAGVVAEVHQKVGRPGKTICEMAQELKADLIVIGRRGHSVFDEMLLGSVSNYVVHHADTTVLVCNLQHPANHLEKDAVGQSQACAAGDSH